MPSRRRRCCARARVDRQGSGMQVVNDTVIIPALVARGIDPADGRRLCRGRLC